MSGTWHPSLNLMNKKFGRLIVIEKCKNLSDKGRHTYWLCLCKCGNKVKCRSTGLTAGHNLSCGCFRRESSRKRALNYKQLGYNRFTKVGLSIYVELLPKNTFSIMGNKAKMPDKISWRRLDFI